MEKQTQISSKLEQEAKPLIQALFASSKDMIQVPSTESFFLSKVIKAEGFLLIGELNQKESEGKVYILQKK